MVDKVFKFGKPEIERVPVAVASQMTTKCMWVYRQLNKERFFWTIARWEEGGRDIERFEMIKELLD